jgi:hypothetical protein
MLFMLCSLIMIGCSKAKDKSEVNNISDSVIDIKEIVDEDKEEENMVLQDDLEKLFENIKFTDPYN